MRVSAQGTADSLQMVSCLFIVDTDTLLATVTLSTIYSVPLRFNLTKVKLNASNKSLTTEKRMQNHIMKYLTASTPFSVADKDRRELTHSPNLVDSYAIEDFELIVCVRVGDDVHEYSGPLNADVHYNPYRELRGAYDLSLIVDMGRLAAAVYDSRDPDTPYEFWIENMEHTSSVAGILSYTITGESTLRKHLNTYYDKLIFQDFDWDAPNGTRSVKFVNPSSMNHRHVTIFGTVM